MTDDRALEPDGASDNGDEHGHDDHAHADEALGPVDWAAWTIGAAGVGVGAVMWLCFALATLPT